MHFYGVVDVCVDVMLICTLCLECVMCVCVDVCVCVCFSVDLEVC